MGSALNTAAKKKLAQNEKAKDAKKKEAPKHVPALGSYNDKPMFIVNSEKEQFNFQFGLGKAKMLLQPQVQSALKRFVETNGEAID